MYQRNVLTHLKESVFCSQLGFFTHRVMPWTTLSAVQRDRRSKMRESGFSDVIGLGEGIRELEITAENPAVIPQLLSLPHSFIDSQPPKKCLLIFNKGDIESSNVPP